MQPARTGRTIGNYVVKGLLGEGGMGAVFAGEHRFLGEAVAIKMLHASFASDRVVTERFLEEAKAGRGIAHPNIVKIFDFGQCDDDGSLYLVMELLVGESLADRLKRGRVAEAEALRIGVAVAEGLIAAHARGVVHRDLKPANIFLAGGEVKVLDFGIAKVLDGSSRTDTGTLLGTPRYMAPEQARGERTVGPACDIYSLGAVLFELVTGQPPFDASNVTGLIIKSLSELPPRPSDLARVSPELDALILGCLEKDPAARPSSMAVLRDALQAASGRNGTRVMWTRDQDHASTKDAIPVVDAPISLTPSMAVPAPVILSAPVILPAPVKLPAPITNSRNTRIAIVAILVVAAGLAIGFALPRGLRAIRGSQPLVTAAPLPEKRDNPILPAATTPLPVAAPGPSIPVMPASSQPTTVHPPTVQPTSAPPSSITKPTTPLTRTPPKKNKKKETGPGSILD